MFYNEFMNNKYQLLVDKIKSYKILTVLPSGDKIIECTVGLIECSNTENKEKYERKICFVVNSKNQVFCEFRESNSYSKIKKYYMVDLITPVNIFNSKHHVFEYGQRAVYGTEKGEILFIEKENEKIDSVSFEDYSVKYTNIKKFDKNNKSINGNFEIQL